LILLHFLMFRVYLSKRLPGINHLTGSFFSIGLKPSIPFSAKSLL